MLKTVVSVIIRIIDYADCYACMHDVALAEV